MPTKRIPSVVRMNDYMEQARAEAASWALLTVRDPDRIKDFGAGFTEGFRQAMNIMRLHAGITFPDPRAK